MVGNSFSLYDLKTLCPILESRSWFAKRSLYAFFVLSLVFHSASFAGDVVLSTRSNRSSPNAENIELRILAAISFLLLLHLAFNYKNYKNTYLEFFQAFIDGFTISLTSGNNFSSNNTGQNKKYRTYDKSDTNRNNSIRFSANRHMTKFRRIRLFSDCQELSDIQKL